MTPSTSPARGCLRSADVCAHKSVLVTAGKIPAKRARILGRQHLKSWYHGSLKLIALEPSDLTLISAHLQDTVVKVGDMTFSKPTRGDTAGRFVLHGNRLVQSADRNQPTERRRAALRIERVLSAQVHGFTPADRSAVIAVLALSFAPDADAALAPAGVLTLVCAGNASVRLGVECVELVLEDLGPAWQAGAVPDHM